MTKNLHLNHPEDLILGGDLSVLDWFATNSNISVKMDGAPAVVWGTNPENGEFFVGTKSVFNKKKIKINYTTDDIIRNHPQNEVRIVLQTILDLMPRDGQIYQGDFIGFGGDRIYTPNTITYDFGKEVQSTLIIAPHTVYTGDTIINAVASPLTEILESNDDVMFVQPTVDCIYRFDDSVESIRRSVEKSKFLNPEALKEVKIILNAFVREGKSISPNLLEEIVGDWNLTVSYFQIVDIKEQMIEAMKIYDGPLSYIGDNQIGAEGFVRHNEYGSLKLVDRYQFAQANFNNTKFRSN